MMGYAVNNQYQHGVALITALLIVALATVAAVAMASRQQLDIRRTANILQADQAYVFALGGEAFAKQVLLKDKANIDEREDDWAIAVPPMPFKGGVLQFSVDDMAGLFNLNNLVKDGRASEWDVERFKKLLALLKEKEDVPEEFKRVFVNDLVYALVDWIDADGDLSPGGAEDSDYLERERPYRAANRSMVSPSELLLVKGFTPAIYNVVRPYVMALPKRTRINVNTAKDELIQTLFEDVTCPDMSKLNRSKGVSLSDLLGKSDTASEKVDYDVFKTPDEFARHDAFAGCRLLGIIENPNQQKQEKDGKAGDNNTDENNENNSGENAQNENADEQQGRVPLTDVVAVNSEYFLLDAYAEVGPEDQRTRTRVYSLLQRKDGKVTAIMRAQGAL